MHGGWKWKPKVHKSTLWAEGAEAPKKEFSSCFGSATGAGEGCDDPWKVFSGEAYRWTAYADGFCEQMRFARLASRCLRSWA